MVYYETLLPHLTKAICAAMRQSPTRAPALTEEEEKRLFSMAKENDLAHLLFPLTEGDERPFARAAEQYKMHALFRSEQQSYERERIYGALEEEGIPYLPLKGSVLRDRYPEPWMRSCGDIDILIHKEHLERAVKRLTEKEGFRASLKDSHDISLYSESGVHLELHFSLMDKTDEADEILDGIWTRVHPVKEHSMRHEMPDPLFYYYHIAHMAKHMTTTGGCGIRPFLDVWVLWHRTDGNRAEREALLKKGGLLTFGRIAEQLSEIWFSGEPHTDLTKQLEAYVVEAGLRNGKEHGIQAQRVKAKQGRLSYAFSRVFLNRAQLEVQYPVLEKHAYLLPVCWVRRWCRLIKNGKLRSSMDELKKNQSLSDEELSRVARLLQELDI